MGLLSGITKAAGSLLGGDTLKDVGNIIDDLHMSGEEKAEAKQKLETILIQAEQAAQAQVSARWEADLKHGSWLSKNIRPLTLIFLTAVFTIGQIKNIINIIQDTDTIISVFAGRLFDIGINAEEEMKKINSFIHKNSNCKSLWASPRSSYDVYRALNSNTDIITISEDLINRFKLFDKKPEKYSLETVKMFYNDAKKSKFKI